MIHIKRTKETPAEFQSEAIKSDMKKYHEYFSRSRKNRAQEKFSISVVGDTPETVECVGQEFLYKCATCETALSKSTVICDSWRPRTGAKGYSDEFSMDHYWWLAYEWRNKYALCTHCNNYKATWFPVDGKRATIRSSYLLVVQQENALLVDPCIDYPEEHMYVNVKNGSLLPLSKKGAVTIEILKLNRKKLLAERMDTIQQAEAHLDLLVKTFKSKKPINPVDFFTIINNLADILGAHPQRPHVMVWRQIVINFLKKNPQYRKRGFYSRSIPELEDATRKSLVETLFTFNRLFKIRRSTALTYKVKAICNLPANYSRKKPKPRPKSPLPAPDPALLRLYPEKVEVVNFKSIRNIVFDFPIPIAASKSLTTTPPAAREPWKFLLGENGVGKSSILQAIALVLSGNKYIRNLNINPASILKHGKRKGHVKIWFVGVNTPVTLQFTAKEMTCDFSTGKINVLGYGSTRLLPKEGTSLQPEKTSVPVKVKNLFDYTVALTDADAWLLSIDNADFDQVAKALKDVLDLPSVDTYFIRENGRVYFSKNHETLDQLSEGYRSVIALAVDIMKSLSGSRNPGNKTGGPAYEIVEGIVLIDELSSHLHPRWQMKIVTAFRKAFPKLQFIVTSHDPLSLKGIGDKEVLLLKKNDQGEVIGISDLPDPSEMRAEQILTSEFFGLSSTLDPDLEIKFNTYHTLLSQTELTPTEKKMLKSLKEELKDKKHLGDSLREELMYSIIDQSLADYKQNSGKVNRDDLFNSTKTKVLDIWDKHFKK